MELSVSSRRPLMSYGTDLDDKEVSDDDDDRNHKHRRRDDARSQSFEYAVTEHLFTRTYRRGSKPFQNGHLCGETGSLSNETWKRYSFNPLEKEVSRKFEQKRPGLTQLSSGPSDLNQKSTANQPFSGDPGAVRCGGRGSRQLSQCEPRFSSIDIASQMVQKGSVPHSLFAGRGLAMFSSFHGQSPNDDLAMLHRFGLQGSYRPAINSSLNTGLARKRCRDFEEQGFCLRGDMCPMEHGMNRIVVEDVQSLSQLNLPISLASANLSTAPVGTGPTLTTSIVTNTLLNSKGPHGKGTKDEVSDIDSADADFYDPDQPLWRNDSHTSTGSQCTSQTNVQKVGYSLNNGLSGNHRVGRSEGSNNDLVTSREAVASLKTRSSVQGRIISIKKRTEMGENRISKASPSNIMQNETMSDCTQNPLHRQKMNNSESSLKVQSGGGRMSRKSSQKAQRTLFVNGIPHQNNKKEFLLSHFQKFGEVVNIFIPLNSERAFVQFSKREEAEAALMAPDAVMSNRFIKLWWANRDIIHDMQTASVHDMWIPPHGLKVSSVNSVANKRKLDFQTVSKGSHAPVSASDHPNVVDDMEVTPPMQKKRENLELMKEELRKKQELLDQKRNDFRLMLDKLEKKATGPKAEIAPEQLAKKQKLEILANSAKTAAPSGSDHDAILPLAQDEVVATISKSVGPSGKQTSKTNLSLAHRESSSLKSLPLSFVNLGSPVVNNRFKLDNRPTAFKVVPPLPDGLADVHVLKEHFSPYGDLSNVKVDNSDTSKAAALIFFRTRHSAEKAFWGCKSWKGHNLQFVWLNSSNSGKDDVTRQSSSLFSKDSPTPTSRKPYTSGDGDSEKPEEPGSVADETEPCETNQSSWISGSE